MDGQYDRISPRPASVRLGWRALPRCLIRDEHGGVAIIMALTIAALMGMVGLAVEVTTWYLAKRGMQNAADSGAIAAANKGGTDYQQEARAVAARYGFADGADGITVTALNGQTCPDGTNTCYRVTVSKTLMTQYFSQFVGYTGTGISASALAAGTSIHEYCILALATTGEAIRANGAPKADLAGCDVRSNASARCNGHDLNARYSDAVGPTNSCAQQQNTVSVMTDPYLAYSGNIPPDPCGGTYHEAPSKKKDPALPSSNTPSGTKSTNLSICGDVQLGGDLTFTGDRTLVIYNGTLDLNGHTLSSASGSALTVIFTGDSGGDDLIQGSGTIDVQAPSAGTWQGFALFRNSSAPSATMDFAGNNPTFNLTGLMYLPNVDATFSGAINKSSNGASCFAMVLNTLLINGTGAIADRSGCAAAGIDLPTGTASGGTMLLN